MKGMHAYDLKQHTTVGRLQQRNVVEQPRVQEQRHPRFHLKVIAVCTLVGLVGMGYLSKGITVMQLNQKVHALQAENQLLAQEVDELRTQLQRLSSPYHVEELARTQLGMVYPNQQSVIWKVVPTEVETARPARPYESFLNKWLSALQDLSRHVLG